MDSDNRPFVVLVYQVFSEVWGRNIQMKLYSHQEESLKQTEGLNRVAYYHDMGLGKTFTGAEKMFRLGARVNLLICQKSKIADWIDHFAMNYAMNHCWMVYDLTKSKELDWYLSAVSDDLDNPFVGIINYELAWRRKDLLKLHDFTLMLDESSLIQNKTAKQTKFILKLQPANVILLSGTPTSGKYENLWTQIHLLGWEISEKLYQRQYVNWKTLRVPGGQYVKVVDKDNPYKNVERLKGKMREHGAVFLKTEECFDLPEQNFIEMSISKPKYYDKFMKDSIVTVDGVEMVGDTSLTKRLYARELCGIYSEAKLEAFRDLVQSTNERIIVFYNFTAELERLVESVLPLDRPYDIINGNLKTLTAYENYSDAITFVQYQAGAMGLNLQKANKIIYYSLPERSELFEQSKKRIHRIGQDRPCFYYLMICTNTVEESIYEALKQRKDFTDELFRECDKNGTGKTV